MERIKFLNTYIDNMTMDEAVKQIDIIVKKKENAYVVTPNLDHIVQLERDPQFKKIYEDADLILADGKPLIWISKKYGTSIKEKISGADLFPLICEMAAKNHYRMFFLGAAKGVAKIAAQNLMKRYEGLQVVGTYSPSCGFENKNDEMNYIKDMIVDSKPDILIVALGAPKQEKFIYQNKDILKVPISLGLGASLDFEAGTLKRAPKWMADNGFEWLFRITQDPKRLVKRYWKDAVGIIPIIRKYKKKHSEI